jgi:hypothetical protein
MGSTGSRFIRSKGAVAGVVVTVVAGSGALAWQAWSPRPESALTATTVAAAGQRRETRPTLDPTRFVGKAAHAHQVARDMPDLLDALYCYCECDKSIGHKSLLSCYTDGHAAT